MSISFAGIPRLAKAVLPRVKRLAGATMLRAAAVVGSASFLTGCATIGIHPCSQTAASLELKEVEETVENNGDPEVGTVIHIRQMHRSVSPIKDPTDRKMEVATVGRWQARIFQYLSHRNFKHVFAEALDRDMSPQSQEYQEEASKLRPLFPEGFYQNPNDEQQKALRDNGATLIFGYLYPDVTVHRTISPEERNPINEQTMVVRDNQVVAIKDWDKKLLFDTRERIAVREVMGFLGEHPGETVALIYGRAHELKDDFDQFDPPPKLSSVDFPKVYRDGIHRAYNYYCSGYKAPHRDWPDL